jgi:hypothetical protein
MQAKGRATIPLRISFRPFRVVPLPTAVADLSITSGSFVLLTGMTPAQFDADVHLADMKIVVQKSADPASPDFRLPGLRGHIGDGPISVSGDITLPSALTLSGLSRSRFNLTADLDPIDLVIPDFITAKLNGQLLLRNSENGGPLLRTAEGAPLILAHGTVGIPPVGVRLTPTVSLSLAPELKVRALAGDDLRFRYRPVEAVIAPASFVDIGGRLSRQEVTLHGEVRSGKGELTFPNARLDLISGRASIDRNPGQPMRVKVIEAEAVGAVGDYQVILEPTGQVYPAACYDPECVPLDLGIRTLPYLDPAYAAALLVGPVVGPTVSTGPDAMRVLSAAQRPVPAAGAITGFMLPGLGTYNVGLDYAFKGPVSLRLRQRLFGTTYVQYVSPISGANATSRLALNYQVTPGYFLGAGIIWSPTALTQTLYQINRFWTF